MHTSCTICSPSPPTTTVFLPSHPPRTLGMQANYTAVAETCNTFRVYGDIWDSYESIRSITNWYGDDEGNFSLVAGPGSWNDADMVSPSLVMFISTS